MYNNKTLCVYVVLMDVVLALSISKFPRLKQMLSKFASSNKQVAVQSSVSPPSSSQEDY